MKRIVLMVCVSVFAMPVHAAAQGRLSEVIDLVQVIKDAEALKSQAVKQAAIDHMSEIIDIVAAVKEIKIIQVTVLQQGQVKQGELPPDVLNKEGGNCGYHALKNVGELMQCLDSNVDPAECPNLTSVKSYQDFMQWAVPKIEASHEDISWLDAGALENLVTDMQLQDSILVVEDIAGVAWTDKILEPLKNFAQAHDGMLGFVWNAGSRVNVKEMGGSHWVGFVAVKKNNSMVLYYMNSVRVAHPNFEHVENFIKQTPQKIDEVLQQQIVREMNANLDGIEDRLDILQKKDNRNDIFTQFVGCVEITGPMPKAFTEKNLQDGGFSPEDSKKYRASMNRNWQKHRENVFPTNTTKRLYGFWINPEKGTGSVFQSTAVSCAKLHADSGTKWLVDDGTGSQSLFAPATVQDMTHMILETWKDSRLPKLIQERFIHLFIQVMQSQEIVGLTQDELVAVMARLPDIDHEVKEQVLNLFAAQDNSAQ